MRQDLLKKTYIISISLLILLFSLPAGCADHQKHQSPTAKHRFDNIEFWVKMFEDPERDAWQKPAEVVAAMNLSHGNVVADLGAGTGYFTRRFAVAVGPSGRALGLDIEASMVKYMTEDAAKLNLTNYEARVVKTDDTGLAPGSVDVIFLCNTYHHIENRVQYFKNVAKSLKPDGRVISVDFFKDTDFGPPRDHKLSKEVVLKEMKQAGYKLIKSHSILEQQYFLEFAL